jgi:hypothetical protein
MLSFKSPEDLAELPADDPAFPLVKELIKELIEAYTWEGHPYNPDWYGYILLVQEGDATRTLDELWDSCTLLNIPREAAIKIAPEFSKPIYIISIADHMPGNTANPLN